MKSYLLLFALALLAATTHAREVTLYVATGGKGTEASPSGIYRATFDTESGELTEPVLAAEMAHPSFLAVAPDGSHLFSGGVHEEQGGVAAFRIEPDGNLEALNTQSSEGKVPCFVDTDGTGKVLLVANFVDGKVAALPIGEDGALKPATSVRQHEGSSVLPRQTSPHPHSIYPGPGNRLVYVPDLGMDQVVVYRLDPEAVSLEPVGAGVLPPGSGPRHMKFSNDGRFAYVLNEMGLSVSQFALDGRGSMELVETVPTVPEDPDRPRMSASEIRMHPSGKFLYTANRSAPGSSSLSVFKVETGHRSSGKLERIQVMPAEVHIPRNFAIDPTGQWLLAGGQRSNEIAIFSIDSKTGMLTFTGRKIPVPRPVSLEFLDRGKPGTPAEIARALDGFWDAEDRSFYKRGRRMPLTPEILEALLADPQVRSLHLDSCPVDLELARILGSSRYLERLLIVHTDVGDPERLAELAKIDSLQEIHVGSSDFGDEGLLLLTELRNLRSLRLAHVGRNPDQPITAEGLRAVAEQLPDLEVFYINLHRMEDAMVQQLARLRNLQTLGIEGVTEEFIAKVQEALPGTLVLRRGRAPGEERNPATPD